MQTSRLEAFSDGVLAIIITIMVLELHIPEGRDLEAFIDDASTGLLIYVLSFVYLGIYWNNHHHMFQLTQRVNGGILWANLHLLFWLSLFPFSTAWMAQSTLSRTSVAIYGLNLLAAAMAWFILQSLIIRDEGRDGTFARAIGSDTKGKISPVLYIAGILSVVLIPGARALAATVSMVVFVAVAIMWVVPDRRIENAIAQNQAENPD